VKIDKRCFLLAWRFCWKQKTRKLKPISRTRIDEEGGKWLHSESISENEKRKLHLVIPYKFFHCASRENAIRDPGENIKSLFIKNGMEFNLDPRVKPEDDENTETKENPSIPRGLKRYNNYCVTEETLSIVNFSRFTLLLTL
jgi:hypothetical protein